MVVLNNPLPPSSTYALEMISHMPIVEEDLYAKAMKHTLTSTVIVEINLVVALVEGLSSSRDDKRPIFDPTKNP